MKKMMEMRMNKVMAAKAAKQTLAAVVMTASMTMTAFAGTAGTTTTLPKESYQNDMNREAEAAYMDAMRTRWTAEQLKTVYPIDINQDGVLEYVVQTATKDEDYIWEDICTYVMSFNGTLQVNEIDDRLSRYPMIEIGIIPEEKKMVAASLTGVRDAELVEYSLENGQMVQGKEYYWDLNTSGSDREAEAELCKTVFPKAIELTDAQAVMNYLPSANDAAGNRDESRLYPNEMSKLGKDVMMKVRNNLY
ncbi:hypothetical protein [uncultured Clostridium sp.]|uniref:hypothetical protein n=1 Tax=uncultured Clostridium sp. TaxID=59620 RepID=UPI00258B1CEB|nr:hypothetical protein [uncultured Clostridium sp.]